MVVNRDFSIQKQHALQSMQQAIQEELVDDAIIHLLKLINDSQEYYTSSSCAGRIMLLELPSIGDKIRAKCLGKWHMPVTLSEIMQASSKASQGLLWLLAQSPIFHVGACSVSAADHLVKLSVSCGFKNSSVKSLGKKVMVEVASTERVDAPIGRDGRLLCSEEHLELLVSCANHVMEKSSEKLTKFERAIGKYLSTQKSTMKSPIE